MSALPPKADMFSVKINVCYVPKADVLGRPGTDSGTNSTPTPLYSAKKCPARQIWSLLGGRKATFRPLIGPFGIVAAHENFPFSGVVSRADQTLFLHALDEGRGAVVADAEPPLHVAGRGLAVA